jgi:Integrase zinc binding domain
LLNQSSVSGRQARWLEKISSFTFDVEYVPGSENVLADALSRMYSYDSPGTTRARSEFTVFDSMDEDSDAAVTIEEPLDMVLLAGMEAVVATTRPPRSVEFAGAESGRPETSKEFAARVKNKFVLHGPRVRTEGRSEDANTINTPLPTIHRDDPHINDRQSITEPITEANENISGAIMESNKASDPNDTALINILNEDAGVNLLQELCDHYKNDAIFKAIIDRPKDFRNFEVKDGLIYLKLNGKSLLCIPKLLINERSIYEIIISEAHSLLAHLGATKTVNYLKDHVWWKDMVSDTKSYCETCTTCKRSKPTNQKPYGLLNPLNIPSEPWESIGVDFVGPLPLSNNRDSEFDSITVIICLLTAMVEIIPSKSNYKAQDIAELMFEHVYKHHGLPKTIISDRDVLFTSTFWGHLNTLIGIKLKMSSAYHPQTDGATERANRTITQMLRQCISPNQKDWVSKLPTIQFAINSARSESTGYAPFFLNTGRMPRAMIWNSANSTEYANVREFAQKRKLALMSAHDSIIGARIKQTRDANRKRQTVPFKTGDFVYLSTKNITFAKGLARKLIPKYIGPYKIIKDFSNQSFKLELPAHLKQRGVHDVFHSSLLRIHVPNDDRLFPGRMDTQIGGNPDVEDEWAVELIRSHAGSGENAIFEIKWKSGDITWMPYYQIRHLQALDAYLELMGVNAASELVTGKGKPPQEDPQVFMGAMSLNYLKCLPSLPAPVSSPIYLLTTPLFPLFLDINSIIFSTMNSFPTFLPLTSHLCTSVTIYGSSRHLIELAQSWLMAFITRDLSVSTKPTTR